MAENTNAPEGTYSAKPFISKDGLFEGVRAEVKVVTGYGAVIEVNDSEKGNSKQVKFAVRNTKFTPSGWTRDKAVQKKIAEAEASGEPIHFRLETRRKDGVDRTKPMSELAPAGDMSAARENTVKSLSAVRLDDDENWTISADAVTRLDEDPQTGGLHSAYNMSEEDLAAGKPAVESPWTGGSNSGREPAPYVGRLRSGAVNPGSTALLAALSFFNFLMEYEREEGVEIEKDRRREMAHTMMLIANKLQFTIYSKKLGQELENVDLTAGSHSRARGLIFESIRSFAPITDEIMADEGAYKKWQKTVYSSAYAMWEWAIDEVDPYIG